MSRALNRKPTWPFTLNGGSAQARGLKFWYADPLVGSSFILDLAGKSNHGQFGTNTGALPTWAIGKDGGHAVFLPGTPGNRIIPRGAFGITGNVPVTVSAWVRYTLDATIAYEVLCNFGNDVINQEVFFARNPSGQAYFEFGGGAGAVTGTTVMGKATWYHLCAVYTGAANFLYVNGIQEATAAYSSANIGTNQFVFGSYLNAGTYKFEMAGRVDDLRIYNRALPALEVRQIYNPATRWQLRYQPRSLTARSFKASVGGPWPHFGRRSRDLSGGMITMG